MIFTALLLAASSALAFVLGAMGFALGRRLQKSASVPTELLAAEAKRRAAWESAIQKLTAERDQALAIATTHEVKWTPAKSPIWATHEVFGKDRTFDGTLDMNLEAIERELRAAFGEKYIRFTFNLIVVGSWSKYLGARGWHRFENGIKKDYVFTEYSPFQIWGFSGSPGQVVAEVRAMLMDPAWDLWDPKKKAWLIESAPIRMTLDRIEFRRDPEERPPSHEVQVTVVRTEVQQVPVPVLLPDPELAVAPIPALDSDRLAAMVEVEVQSALARRLTAKAHQEIP